MMEHTKIRMCECGHNVTFHTILDDLTSCAVQDCPCAVFVEVDETRDQIRQKTHEVELGDKLYYKGMTFVISEVHKRLFQAATMKVQSIEELMSEMADEPK